MISLPPPYAGQIAFIDLNDQQVKTSLLDRKLAYRLCGGKGFGAKLLLDLLPAGTDPLAPDNMLILATGPLTGMPFLSKAALITKSPLTHCFLDCYAGSGIGAELKSAGYDSVVITGSSKEPVYIAIIDDQISINKAGNLWGGGTLDIQDAIKKDLNEPTAQVATIGIGGENLVKYAAVITGRRAFGRGGAGAVMGSKKLKAIAVKGNSDIQIADAVRFQKIRDEFANLILKDPYMNWTSQYGTSSGVLINNEKGALPTRNNQSGTFQFADEISGERMLRDRIFIKNVGCLGCFLSCGKISHVKSGKFKGTITDGPEYETIFALGSNCYNRSIESIIKADQLCDVYGLDTITTGCTIAFILECASKKLLSKDHIKGLHNSLKFGNPEVVLELIELIARRKLIGDMLADGTRIASTKIGKGSDHFAMHVKGMETSGWNVRSLKGMALAFATSDRGGDHNRGGTQPIDIPGEKVTKALAKQKANHMVNNQNLVAAIDCMVICRFTIFSSAATLERYADLLSAATGLSYTANSLLKIGDRAYNLSMYFNHREGISGSADRLPLRDNHDPLPDGPPRGSTVTLEEMDMMLSSYYEKRGWKKKSGRPPIQKLRNLNIDKKHGWIKDT